MDYKLLTRVLAIQLTSIIPSLLHENQASFILGCSIFDQTQLAQSMIDLAEATEDKLDDGAIEIDSDDEYQG